jgi:thymidylate kinase
MIETQHRRSRPILISFSGIDGAGKSTQIQALATALNEAGMRCRIVSFWDDIAKLKSFREMASVRIFGSEKGVGAPSAPVARRDKNVRIWVMTIVRLCLYLVDAISTRVSVHGFLRQDIDVILLDRYIYDQIANLNLESHVIRAYARIIISVAPRPDVSYVLDADPCQARARKPEYPVEFLRMNRKYYLMLSRMINGTIVIAPKPVEDVRQAIAECVMDIVRLPAGLRLGKALRSGPMQRGVHPHVS